MVPAQSIHDWARYVPPSDLGGGIIVAVAICGVLFSLVRSRAALPQSVPVLAYLLLATAAACSWVGSSVVLARTFAVLSVLCLWLHFRIRDGELESDESHRHSQGESDDEPRSAPRPGAGEFAPSIEDPFRSLPLVAPAADSGRVPMPRASRVALFLGFVAVAALLLDDLGGYAGTLLAWESPVVQHGFVAAFTDNVGFWGFLKERFLWDDGVLSAGHTSLFFGPPTFLLFKWLAATPWTLRVASVIATLCSMAVLFSFVRRYHDAVTATVAALLFGFSTPVLYYGRYGSSIAGTMLAVLLAIYATWFFLERDRGSVRRAALCGIALFVATLQYAPGRLVVVLLLALIPFALISERRRPTRTRWVGAGLIAVMALGVWSFEAGNRREHYFLHGRGEQVFGMFRNPNTIPALVGTRKQFSVGKMDFDRKVEIVGMVVSKTWTELMDFVSPTARQRIRGAVVKYDPPPMTLYFAPIAVFALLGLARSLASCRSSGLSPGLHWRHSAPVLFAIGYCAVLLFTNRIDSHRGVLLVIPLSIWVGLGAREVVQVMQRLQVPTSLLVAFAVLFTGSAVYSDLQIRYPARVAVGRVPAALAKEVVESPGRVSVWFARDHREMAWLSLRLLEHSLRDRGGSGTVLPQAITDGLRGDKGGPRRLAIRQASQRAKVGTLFLGPRAMFHEAAQKLQASGLRVSERNAAGYRYFRIDGGARRTGISDSAFRPMEQVFPPPTRVPVVLSEGPRIYLSDLDPDEVEFGFAEPKMNMTWQGRPVVMGGVEYPKAIGTHSWTSMRFEVPKGAIALQAVVGISDTVRACEATSVEFEVRGADNTVLWKSEVFDFATRPLAIEIPVVNQRHVKLVTTEADDGRDCDHANWGRVAFLLRKGTSLEKFPVVRGKAGQ